jgi:hypothetical protein
LISSVRTARHGGGGGRAAAEHDRPAGADRAGLSFPVVKVGKTGITIWIVVKALLILFFSFRLPPAAIYLDYKVYPAFGVNRVRYAINTSSG